MREFNQKKNFGRRDKKNYARSSGRNFRRSGRRNSERFGRRDSGRSNRPEKRTMHEAICDKCGKRCEVPFIPTEGKPIYCSDCFRNIEKPESKNNQFAKDFEQINAKLDKIIKALKIDL